MGGPDGGLNVDMDHSQHLRQQECHERFGPEPHLGHGPLQGRRPAAASCSSPAVTLPGSRRTGLRQFLIIVNYK